MGIGFIYHIWFHETKKTQNGDYKCLIQAMGNGVMGCDGSLWRWLNNALSSSESIVEMAKLKREQPNYVHQISWKYKAINQSRRLKTWLGIINNAKDIKPEQRPPMANLSQTIRKESKATENVIFQSSITYN